MSLKGKVALVTGGSRGIGAATCMALGERGADIVVNFLGNKEKAEQVVHRLVGQGRRAFPYQANVGYRQQVDRMVADIIDRWGRIDILVNNAGTATRASILEIKEEEWDEVLRTNLKGTFNCTQAVLATMIDHGSGCIVNVSTLGVRLGGGPGVHYSAAKGGIVAFTRAAGRAVARFGVRINAVAPPSTETDMLFAMIQGLDPEPIERAYPLGRFAKPAEVAAVIAFLCSADASFLVGETIWISGGQ